VDVARTLLTAFARDPRRPLAALVVAGYAGVAFAVHDLYPFSRFDMYSRARSSASRIVARDAAGHVAEVERFDAWQCERPVDVSPGTCGAPGSYTYTPYIDESRARWVAEHAAQGANGKSASTHGADGERAAGEPVDVVRRIWRVDEGPPHVTDCLLERCSAVRR
jgi:hypothetical protein